MKVVSKDYITELLAKGTRMEGRGVNDYRRIGITTRTIPHAEGSAEVSIGNTKVLAAVKIGIGDPLPDKPDEGALITSAELLPLADANYEIGPPSPDAIEFARVVDRGIRAAEIIDLPSLFIEKGKVWSVFVDIYVLNYDGNLFDSGTLASVSALLSARMPKYEDEKVVREGKLHRLKTNGIITSCTFAKIGNSILLDPEGNEETFMDARLTITNDDASIRAMQKGKSGAFTFKEVDGLIDLSFEKSKELRALIDKEVTKHGE